MEQEDHKRKFKRLFRKIQIINPSLAFMSGSLMNLFYNTKQIFF
jgi:hypothetical protein